VAVVDSIQQHGQLRGIELNSQRVLGNRRHSKPALLEALVIENEAAPIPGENLHPVAASTDESEEVSRVDVLLPLAAHDRAEPVDALSQINRVRREKDGD